MLSTVLSRASQAQVALGVRQVLTGFYDLQAAGIIELTVETGKPMPGAGHPYGLRALVDGDIRLAYDMADGYNFLYGEADPIAAFDKQLDQYDLYFKYTCIRSRHELLRNRDKIRPLGLISRYHGSRNNMVDRGLRPFDATLLAKYVVGASPWTARLLSDHSAHAAARGRLREPTAREYYPERYESLPSLRAYDRALYISRAWDPDDPALTHDESREDRLMANRFRAGLIRAGKDALGPCFLGGLQRTAYAVQHYADCILDAPEADNHHAYVDTLRGSQVGIATQGLYGCVSQKLAEYVAMSRAIVSQESEVEMPGDLWHGGRCETGETPEACVEAAARLLDAPDKAQRMMWNNLAYYQTYVRPAAMVLRTLEIALAHRDRAPL